MKLSWCKDRTEQDGTAVNDDIGTSSNDWERFSELSTVQSVEGLGLPALAGERD